MVLPTLPSTYENRDLASCKVALEWNTQLEETTCYLEKATWKIKKWADWCCSDLNFKVGD